MNKHYKLMRQYVCVSNGKMLDAVTMETSFNHDWLISEMRKLRKENPEVIEFEGKRVAVCFAVVVDTIYFER